MALVERRNELGLQDLGDGEVAVTSRPDRKERVGQIAALGRRVEDLPVTQISAGANRDIARANAAEQKGRG